LDVRHFPRTDADYLAQVKKMAADRGITIAALADDGFFSAQAASMDARIEQALGLGAPLLLTRAAPETAMTWSGQLERINHATGIAKRANVTLALRNAPGTFAASAPDCKRVSKEADSAWLRFALDPAAFDPASDLEFVESKSVALCAPLYLEEQLVNEFLERYGIFCGPLVLEGSGDGSYEHMQSATRRWRIALARFELDRT
jgi:hypothetical protein